MTRHVPLEGNLNLRDLGGYAGRDGFEVRTGCLFRSDELHQLTDNDLGTVAALGIKVVFDLRNEHERALRPSRLPVGVELRERTSAGVVSASLTIEEQIANDDLPVPDDVEFAGIYVALLERLRPEFRAVIELAIDAPARPLLFHCVAGKDRTGIAAALLLSLLEVPRETILDDYELTSTYFAARRMLMLEALMAEHRVEHHRVRPLLEARRPVLTRALDHIDETWGGVEEYAIEFLGVDADVPHRLRDALLVTPAV
jgi:protein-tyrosine phosphatase